MNVNWSAWLRSLALPVCASLLTIVIFTPFALRGVDLHHDGMMLKPALDVRSGQTLFKDTFSHYGILTTYLQVGFLYLFGPSLFALKIGTVLMYGVTAAFLVAAWRMLLPRRLTFLAFTVWLLFAYFYSKDWVFHPWSSAYALTFQSIALYCLLKSASGRRPVLFACLCGIATALVFWCRFTVGTLLFGSIVVGLLSIAYLQREPVWRPARLPALLGGALVVSVPIVLFIYSSGAIAEWKYDNFVFPYRAFVDTALRARLWRILSSLFLLYRIFPQIGYYPNFRMSEGIKALVEVAVGMLVIFVLCLRFLPSGPVGEEPESAKTGRAGVVTSLLALVLASVLAIAFWKPLSWFPFWAFIIPPAILAATAAVALRWLWRRPQADEVAGAPLLGFLAALVALASWLQYYPVYDPRHLFWAVSPGVGVFLYYLFRLARGRTAPLLIGLVVLFLPLAVSRAQLGQEKLNASWVRFDDSPVLRGMYIAAEEERPWRDILAAIRQYSQTHPDTAIVIYGNKSMYATLVPNLANAHPYYIYLQNHEPPPGTFAAREKFIREFRPLVLSEDWRVEVDGKEASASDSEHEYGYAYQRQNMIKNFGYRKLADIGTAGDILLEPGPQSSSTK